MDTFKNCAKSRPHRTSEARSGLLREEISARKNFLREDLGGHAQGCQYPRELVLLTTRRS